MCLSQKERIKGRAVRSIFSLAIALGSAGAVLQAETVTDPAGDFISTYTGPRNGDLDVLSADVTFDGSNFTFTSTQNGPIGQTPTGLYVWGIDRGKGTSGFPDVAPGVTFDSVFVINPAGQSSVRDLISGAGTNIADISTLGDTVTGIVPLSALPSEGFDPSNYLVNLWPRSGAGGTPVISDFAPNNADFAVTATPEPATQLLLCGGFLTMFAWKLRRKRAH